MMKRNRLFLLPLVLFFSVFSSCDLLTDVGLSEDEVRDGLKEALRVGTDTSVTQASKTNGFYGNSLIKIEFPEEAQNVITVVGALPGGDALIDAVVLKINRAAEEAAIKAKPIFIDAITQITIEDAFGILNGSNDAATQYLVSKTSSQLYTAFKPDIQDALTSVGAQQAWDEVLTKYNQVPFVTPVNTDLADHTTHRALDGLFHLVAEEEAKIRTDASHQVTEVLQEVFGDN